MDFTRVKLEEVSSAVRSGALSGCIVGLGRIGLPTAVVMARANINIIGYDVNPKIVDGVAHGISHLADERDLSSLVRKLVVSTKLQTTSNLSYAMSRSDFAVLCLPTPVDERKRPDYHYLLDTCRQIGKNLRKGYLVVVESTVGPGIVENELVPILENASGMLVARDFGIVSCPERANPSEILKSITKTPRIVGGITPYWTEIAAELYREVFGDRIVRVSSCMTANAVKITEMVFRDINIAFANELMRLYTHLGIDTTEVLEACSTKYNFLPHFPGVGVGGPCVPVNPYLLLDVAKQHDCSLDVVRSARRVNDSMPEFTISTVRQLLEEVGKKVKGSRIAILGVTYKPNVRDTQRSPVIILASKLKRQGAIISLFDPMLKGKIIDGIICEQDVFEAVKDSDGIVVGTAHSEFLNLNFKALLEKASKNCCVVDTRQLLEPSLLKELGVSFRSFGSPQNRRLRSNLIVRLPSEK